MSANKKIDLTRSNSICPPPEAVLLECVKRNDSETIRTIINANKSLLTYEYPFTSKTILSIACSEEGIHPSTVQTLLDLGADIEGNAEWKPLHVAAENCYVDILRVILKNLKPGQINSTVEGGNTALHSLVKSEEIKNNDQVFCPHVELLLASGINVNQGDAKDLSPIFWAAKYGYRYIIKTILEKSVNHVDLDGHRLRNKSARNLILEHNLYDGSLPERILSQVLTDKMFALIKQSKEKEFIDYFDALSLTNPSDFLNMDDGSSTLLQYSCEKCLTNVVKYLLEKDININLVTKNNTKKPVDITAENGFYTIFQMLVDHPNVEISSDVLCNLIKEFDHLKFEQIDHEQCCRILLRKLESDRIILDINGEDMMNNTALHYSLRYADQSTTQKLLKLGASLACKNHFGIMPIEDIKPELLKLHLDDCVKFNIKNKNEDKRDFEVIFEYNSLIPPRRSKFVETDSESLSNNQLENQLPITSETEVIAFMSQAPEFKALLKHPIIVSFLFMKWHKIRLLFYTNLLFYILFVLALFSYIFTYYSNFDKTSDLCLVIGRMSCVVLNLTFWVLVMREFFQITVSPKNYFCNFENYVELVLIFITGSMLYRNSANNDLRKQLSSVTILLAAFELVLMIGQHPKFSTNVVMLKTVSVNFFKLLLWYSLLIVAFALSFNILFAKTDISAADSNKTSSGDDKDVFMGPGASLFKTIVMLTGEFDAGSINFDAYPILSKSIFTLFVFMITIILLNLLNGLAVSDTQTIKNDAELVGHITRAQHIFYVESMLLGNIIPTSLTNVIQNFFCCFPYNRNDNNYMFCRPLARKVCLFTSPICQLTVLPNFYGKIFYEYDKSVKSRIHSFACAKSCSDTYLGKNTVKRICAIVKSKREIEEKSSVKCMDKLQAEIIDLKMKIEAILVKLSDIRT